MIGFSIISGGKSLPNHPNAIKKPLGQSKCMRNVEKQMRECLEFEENQDGIRITLAHHATIAQHSILQILSLDKASNLWQNQIQVIDRNNLYLKLYNSDKILFLFKQFLRRLSNHPAFPLKLSINPNNGTIKITLTEVIHLPSKLGKEFYLQVRNIIESTATVLSKNQRLLMEIYELSNRQPNFSHPKELPEKMRRYVKKFGVFLSLTNEEEAESQVHKNGEFEKESRKQILARQLMLQPEDRRLLALYLDCGQLWSIPLKESELELQPIEKEEIKGRIRMPGLTKCRNIYENNYILNCIRINNYEHLDLRLINQGGFTNIYLAEVQFWYVYSGSNNQVVAPANNENFTPEKLIRKLMIIKREERVPGMAMRIRNRIEHEKNILKQIKSGNALFIPKYYLSTEENKLKEDLLSDYVFLPNLIEYVLSHKLSLSLTSKIYILFMLIQGVRYLKLYRIVHLDLKPNNIMISRTMMVKIIDFGESYHPDICPSQHAPGFTMPYSSPESYYPSESFSEKNDIFSIGVIAYEILYGKFPFFLYNEKTHSEIYKYKEYTNHWFYTPEELKNYGDSSVFPLLQLIFGRCLDPDPGRRPQLDWLCLMLRECIDFYL